MSDVTSTIRLNDHMSSTLRTIDQTMTQTIGIMQRLDTQLRTLGTGGSGGLAGLDAGLSAVLAQVEMLEERIISIGTGAGPGTGPFSQMNDQMMTVHARAEQLAIQLAGLNRSNGSGQGQLQELNEQLSAAHRQSEQLSGNRNSHAAGGWLSSLLGSYKKIQNIQKAMQQLSQVTALTDEFSRADLALSCVNDGLRTQAALQQQVLDAANNTRANYTTTASLAASAGRSERFRGDNDAAVRFADSVNKSLTLSGADPQRSAAVIAQISQALNSGTISGQAFNAIMEDGSYLAEAMAAELGVSTRALQQMAADGKLTTETLTNAVMHSGAAIDEAFAKLPITFSQNTIVFKNTIGSWLTDLAQADGALGRLNQIFAAFNNSLLQHGAIFDDLSAVLFVVVHILELIAGGIGHVLELIDTLGAIFDAVINTIIILLLMEAVIAVKTLAEEFIAGLNLAMHAGQAMAMLGSPIFWIAAAIGIAAAALDHFGVTASDVLTFVGGLFGGLLALVINIGIYLINTFLMISVYLANVFKDPIYAVQLLFYTMVDNILGFLNGLIGAITDGLNWLINKVNDVTGLKVGNINQWVWENPLTKPTSDRNDLLDAELIDYQNYNDWAQKGSDLANGFLQKVSDQQIPAGMAPTGALPDINNIERVGKVGKIDDDVTIADEDMKLLMDLAIQNRVNQINLTVQTTNSPNITQNNTIANELDIAEVANGLAAGVYEANQVTVEQDY